MVEEWIEKLGSEDPSVRRDAAWELGGTDGRAIHPLIRALWDESPGVQEAAMGSLATFRGEAIVWAVLPLLREDAPRRNMALEILAGIGPPAVPLMADRINDKDPDVRKFIVDVFGVIGGDEVMPALRAALSDENPNVRAAGVKALGQLGVREAVPDLVKLLEDEEWVAFVAVEALGNIADEDAVNAIAGLLDGPSVTLRAMAVEALGDIRSPLASSPLFKTLEKVEPEEKPMVARSLVRIGISDTTELGEVLVDLLREGGLEDRKTAVQGLVSLKSRKAVPLMVDIAGTLDPAMPEEEELYRVLVDGLVDIGDDAGLSRLLSGNALKSRAQVVVIDVLGRLGSGKAVEPLIDCLRSSRREVRRAAARAHAAIAGEGTSDMLMEGLADEDGHVRRSAARALGRIGGKQALPALLEIIRKEKYPDVLEDVIEAAVELDGSVLKRLSKSKRSSVRKVAARLARGKSLLPLIHDPDQSVRMAAVLSTGHDDWPEAGRVLSGLIDDPDTEVRKAAVRGMGAIGDGPSRKALVKCLSDSDMWVRMFAVDALSGLKEGSAVSRIEKLLSDKEAPVRIAAVRYLGGFGSPEGLEPALKDADDQVRQEAAGAIDSMKAVSGGTYV